MRSLKNVLFTAVQALFDETLYLKCPDTRHPGYTPVANLPVGQQGEYNIPPDDENDTFGGGDFGYPLQDAGMRPYHRPQHLPSSDVDENPSYTVICLLCV